MGTEEGAHKGVTNDVVDVVDIVDIVDIIDVTVKGWEGDELRPNERYDWVLAV